MSPPQTWQVLHVPTGTMGVSPYVKLAASRLVCPLTVASTGTKADEESEFPAGTTTEHCVVLQVTLAAACEPKVKVVPPGAVLKLVPEIVTVAPANTPIFGVTAETVGKSAKENSWDAGALVTPPSVTVRGTDPTLPAGLTTLQLVEELPQKIPVPWATPKFTVIWSLKPTPVILTVIPPTVGPTAGVKLLTTGLW